MQGRCGLRRVAATNGDDRPCAHPCHARTVVIGIPDVVGLIGAFAPWSLAPVSRGTYRETSQLATYRDGVDFTRATEFAPTLDVFTRIACSLSRYADKIWRYASRLHMRTPPTHLEFDDMDTPAAAVCHWCRTQVAVPRRTVYPVAWKSPQGVLVIQYVDKCDRWIVYGGGSYMELRVVCDPCIRLLAQCLHRQSRGRSVQVTGASGEVHDRT